MRWNLRLTLRTMLWVILISLSIGHMFTLSTVLADSYPAKQPGKGSVVAVIPVHQTIESGLQKFMERGFKEAIEMDAAYIILDINTFGGRVDAAIEIGELVNSSPIPTIAYVRDKAISAGSYIALNADQIAMQKNSSIGAASLVTVTGESITSPKEVSVWVSKMHAAAEKNGRNTEIAAGMVDENLVVDMPEIGVTKKSGEIITLTVDQALQVGYAEMKVNSIDELKSELGVTNLQTHTIEVTFAEKLARFLTDPVVTTLLFIAGIAGIVIELFVPGFGLPGIIGILGFGLYFFGAYTAGFAGVEHVALFVLGFILLVIEIFVPSFGVLGILGIASILGGILLAAYDTGEVLKSLGIASLIAMVFITIVIYIFRRRGVWNRFILKDEQTGETGYNSFDSKEHLLGKRGVADTPLRPAGVALIDDRRIDVVSEGGFMEKGSKLEVVSIEGARIIVKQIKEDV